MGLGGRRSAGQEGGSLSGQRGAPMSLYCLASSFCQAPSLSKFPRPCLSPAMLQQDCKPRHRRKVRRSSLWPPRGLWGGVWTCHVSAFPSGGRHAHPSPPSPLLRAAPQPQQPLRLQAPAPELCPLSQRGSPGVRAGPRAAADPSAWFPRKVPGGDGCLPSLPLLLPPPPLRLAQGPEPRAELRFHRNSESLLAAAEMTLVVSVV